MMAKTGDTVDRDPLCDNCPRALRRAEDYMRRSDWRLSCCKDTEPSVYFSVPQDPSRW
jgi:hypothetical protein